MTLSSLSQDELNYSERTEVIFREDLGNVKIRTARLLATLLIFEWIVAMLAAVIVSPYTWDGAQWAYHIHIYAAIVVGGLLTLFPTYMALARPEHAITPHVLSAAQVLFSGLLIHLSGGRIETHFHIFGSLAFIAFFRDWRPLMTATVIIVTDHALRGAFWPESVYGIVSTASWRTVEHAGWVVFEDFFLLRSIVMKRRDMYLTAQRQAKLEATHAIVEHQVKERTAELEKAKIELEAARDRALASVEAKAKFLANMSHEIRTPLNAIVGFGELLCHGSGLDDVHQEQAALIHSNALHLLSIVNDILDFSKIEAGKMKLFPEIVDIRALINEIVRSFDTQVKAKDIEILVSFSERVPEKGLFDPLRFRQIITNLLGNSIKFTRGKGAGGAIVVLFDALEPDDGQEDTLTLSGQISDSGTGIPEDKKTQIFEAFEQADVSHTRSYGGTGLGLTITAQLLRSMGGDIRVESIENVGSRFHFTARIGKVIDTQEETKESNPSTESNRELSILVAEDNAVNRKLVQALLKRRGHKVTLVNDGAEALAAIQQSMFDVVLMDIQMPVLDGEEATKEIRRLENHNGTVRLPIIALTAHAMVGDRERYLALGMDGYVSKPIDSKKLEHELDRLVPKTEFRG